MISTTNRHTFIIDHAVNDRITDIEKPIEKYVDKSSNKHCVVVMIPFPFYISREIAT